ncbi:hypothetical protein Vadar_003433 [Vaccinium darrowii]|uniref:Uncharacterized protein n=1 Tax=Vaccinium darrowii TaxID=229202 RepID=A0ACB7YBF3_9ERIC|nr:hypothetical protein Vadar_003433 [Vaccinium darrowii]
MGTSKLSQEFWWAYLTNTKFQLVADHNSTISLLTKLNLQELGAINGNVVAEIVAINWLSMTVQRAKSGSEIVASVVPSDEDYVAVKRKEEELIVPEGNKKKKKQVTMPRPACSWVHFGHEFIKECSASHPESSGLKAATKAASDAWKSMSVEEKSKYTRRAREVWDDYLSAAPSCVPKPRR